MCCVLCACGCLLLLSFGLVDSHCTGVYVVRRGRGAGSIVSPESTVWRSRPSVGGASAGPHVRAARDLQRSPAACCRRAALPPCALLSRSAALMLLPLERPRDDTNVDASVCD